MKFPVHDLSNAKQVGDVELDESIFAVGEVRADILHRMVCYQLAKRRSGTRKTQTRSEVSVRSGKVYAQKRTGRARHGARNSPLFVGGAVAHGPRVRSHATKLPKKVRALAMRHALTAKLAEGSLLVVRDLRAGSGKTAILRTQMEALGATKALVVGDADDNFRRAASNLATLNVMAAAGLNVYDILRCVRLVLSEDALGSVQGRLLAAGSGAGMDAANAEASA